MPLVAGIDCGSGFTKALVAAQDAPGSELRIVGRGRARSGINVDQAASEALEQALAGNTRSDLNYIAATGFGRYNLSFRDIAITEITTAARGAFFLFPRPGAVLDIGSQTTRAIAVKDNGRVNTFKSNDKCAAGSGMFIARAAKYLEVPLEQVEDILRGIHDSLADRAGALLKRVGLHGELTFIGGVAHQQGMVRALEQRLNVKVNVAEDCEYVCALGAALLGLRRLASRN
jgi:activator of 2-hydroxyglutaryl-CoA dehydratase